MRFSKVKTKEDFASILGVKPKFINYVLYGLKAENLYTSFEIPKKTGGTRQINAPISPLKDLQKKLQKALWEDHMATCEEQNIKSNVAHGFIPGKSIITNAEIHKNKKYVINIDLEHFFDSFHYGRVVGYFEKNRNYHLSHEVATLIAQIACYNGCLPQGSPCSPIITNLICQIMDYRVLQVAKRYKFDYTRYADDMTFSTNVNLAEEDVQNFFVDLIKEITRAGFSINKEKVRMANRDHRQSVTGLIVNRKLNVERNFYKTTKSMAHKLYQEGTYDIEDGVPGTLNQLGGRFSFIDSVYHYNNHKKSELTGAKTKLSELSAFERQYRHFLFYKYFYGNEEPCIVTEGKTDISYIKAALKSLYGEYQDLIQKNEDGSFTFKVKFLNRTNKLMHLLGLNPDGADGIGPICQAFYVYDPGDTPHFDPNGLDSYLYIYKLRGSSPNHPTIFLLDNETVNSQKPLRKFIYTKSCNYNKARIGEEIQSARCFSRVYKKSNLYIATMPLPNGKTEAEIEDLFDQSWLKNLKIGNRTWDIVRPPDEKTFGKTDLAKYVSSHYDAIDFSGFRGMLNVIRDSIKDYNTACGEEEEAKAVQDLINNS